MSWKPCKIILRAVALIGLLGLVPTAALAERTCCEGDAWLKWNQNRREAYVRGYIIGYTDGFVRACEEAASFAPRPTRPGFDNFPVNKCLDRKWNFSKGIDLSKDITAFYKRYPENRNLFFEEILEQLGQGKSLEYIHRNPPFRPIDATARNEDAN
jgi:hypothetical protein